jgi:hypothetical protein
VFETGGQKEKIKKFGNVLPHTQPTSFKMSFTRKIMIVISRFEFFVRV